MIKIRFFYIVGLLMLSSACVSNKKIILLQNLKGNNPILEGELITYEIPEYRLQFNDIIDINVRTNEDLIENGFSPQQQGQMNMMQAGQGGGDIYYMTGFAVNKNGFIRLPMVGEVYVAQKTLEETRLVIEKELKAFIKSDFYLKVKLGGIRFSTLGEFRKAGKYVVLQDRMTIFEAIAHAGDLTTVAKRDQILLIRQYPEGTKLHRLNLNDRQIIGSPFYFIQPNDQLYAEPMRVREIGSGENAAQSLALLVSSISAVALILNLIIK